MKNEITIVVAEKIEEIATDYMARYGFNSFSCSWGWLNDPKRDFGVGPSQSSLFDLASLTKALVTTPLLYKARNEGLLRFDDLLLDHLGDFVPHQQSFKSMTLEQLLSHSSGLPAWRNFWIFHSWPDNFYEGLNRKKIYEHMDRSSFDLSKTYCYSDLGFILLGFVLESVYGERSLSTIYEELLEELGLSLEHLCFSDKITNLLRIKSSGVCPLRRRELIGIPHDENCSAMGGVSGHAGLFGSASGVVSFLRASLKTSWGQQLFEENLDRTILQKPLLGWALGNNARGFGSGLCFGHQGFTGVDFWIEPQAKFFTVLLTNRVSVERQSSWMSLFRKEIFSTLHRYSVDSST